MIIRYTFNTKNRVEIIFYFSIKRANIRITAETETKRQCLVGFIIVISFRPAFYRCGTASAGGKTNILIRVGVGL